jgi:hypothetical protein
MYPRAGETNKTNHVFTVTIHKKQDLEEVTEQAK